MLLSTNVNFVWINVQFNISHVVIFAKNYVESHAIKIVEYW